MPVDPQVAAFLQRVADLNAPPIYTLTPEQARRAVPQITQPAESVATVENRRIDGPNGEIPVRIYTPYSAVQQAGRGPVRPCTMTPASMARRLTMRRTCWRVRCSSPD